MTALKADIDDEAWETLHLTVSRPLPNPTYMRVAAEVINDCGDEVKMIVEV